MTFPWPYLDLAGFSLRSAMPSTDVALVATLRPGFTESQIARAQSLIEARLRKRYARSIPFGATLTALAATGTNPPPVTLTGTPTLGSIRLVLKVATIGTDGVASFTWSLDNGVTFAGGVSGVSLTAGGSGYVTAPPVTFLAPPAGGTNAGGTATLTNGVVTAIVVTNPGSGYVALPTVTIGPSPVSSAAAIVTGITPIPIAIPAYAVPQVPVFLSGCGLSALFPAGTYAADNVYQAATPVPEVILQWITQIVTPDVYRARGTNPQDPEIQRLEDDRIRVLGTDGKGGELREAADGENGLLDIPFDDALASAVSNGPLGYSETSPYVAFDREERTGRCEDYSQDGTYTR